MLQWSSIVTFDSIIHFYNVTWLLVSEVFAVHKYSGAAPFSLAGLAVHFGIEGLPSNYNFTWSAFV